MKIDYGSKSTWIHLEESFNKISIAEDWLEPAKTTLLKKVIENNQPIIIDAKNVTEIDTAGIQFLLNFIQELVKSGLTLQWQEPSSGLVQTAKQLGCNYLLKLEDPIILVKCAPHLEGILPSFIEEGIENLKDFLDILQSLNLQNIDQEKINHIFRIVHTLKGNCTLFGFAPASDLAHSLETFLDDIRSDPHKLEIFHLDFIVKASEALKHFFLEIQKNNSYDERPLRNLSAIFIELTKRIKDKSKDSVESENLGWRLLCNPKKEIFKKKLEPLNVIKTIEELGQWEITVNIQDLPDFSQFDPLLCYLSFELNLYSTVAKKDLDEILLWLFENEEYSIIPIPYSSKDNAEEIKKPGDSKTLDIKTEALPISSIRVATQKLEALMGSVSEMVILESMFRQSLEEIGIKSDKIYEMLGYLDRNSKELEENVIHISIVPVLFMVNRFPKTVYELAAKLGKEVNFVISGERNELDKNIIEKITGPLLHLIRNAVDHGIENAAVREVMGKDRMGTISFDCYQESEFIVIKISDDGAGIDPEKIRTMAISKQLIKEDEKLTEQEIFQLIFSPGFSTADHITDISGRGVGLDVVAKNIQELGGSIEVHSVLEQGTVFKLRLPLTSAIIECQLFSVGEETYIIPMREIIEMINFDPKNILVQNGVEYYNHHGESLKLINLKNLFNLKNVEECKAQENYALIVKLIEKSFVISCDDLLSQQRIVLKNIEENLCKIPGIAGATILPNGNVGLILNLGEILRIVENEAIQAELKSGKFLILEAMQPMVAKAEKKISKYRTNEMTEYLRFQLNQSEYGIPVSLIGEIYRWKKSSFIPFSPEYFLGLINYRGAIIPVLDLMRFFGFQPIVSKKTNVIIIIRLKKDHQEQIIGLAIDNIPEVEMFSSTDVQLLAETDLKKKHSISNWYIEGFVTLNEKQITLLNLKNIICFKDTVEKMNEVIF